MKREDTLKQIKRSKKKYIIGIDECGTGSLIGNAYVCAFFAPKNWSHPGLNDSKKLTAKKREKLYEELFDVGAQFCTTIPSQKDIDTIGLGAALKQRYRSAYELLIMGNVDPDECLVIIDGVLKVDGLDHVSLPKADSLIPHVMAASVLCKVARDAYVVNDLHPQYPQYNWAKNKGYGSKQHIAAIKKYGLSPFHRTSYKIKGVNK